MKEAVFWQLLLSMEGESEYKYSRILSKEE